MSASAGPGGPGAGAAAEIPRLQLSIRSRAGVQTFWASPDVTRLEGVVSEQGRLFEYSRDGAILAVLNPENVVVYNSRTGAVHITIARPNVSAISLSPLNNFLVTFERLDQASGEPNLIVWNLHDATPINKFIQKNFISENWPTIKWSDDEAYYSRVVPDEVLLFSPKGAKVEPVRRIPLKGVTTAVFGAGAHPYKLATYAPERKSTPANVRIHTVPLPAAPVDVRVVANKSFFKSTSAELLWNKQGSHLLVSTSTDVDQTGKSYYGETGLHFMSADGSFDCIVQLKKEGPIHDVEWSPSGKDFIVAYGFMPAQSTLFDLKCNPVIDFGAAPRNTIRWSPNGKYVCLGGFGNLQGQMDFWDVKSATKIGTAQAHCAAVCEWAPDSRYFVAATVSPRIRVDNGYKIFRYDGGLFHEAPVHELYQVVWRPARAGAYPDRPLSPLRVSSTSSSIGGSSSSSSSSGSSSAKPAAAPAKYQHPNAAKYQHPNASQGSPSSLRSEDEGGVFRYGVAPPPRISKPEDNLPPGWVDDDPKPKKARKPKNKEPKAENPAPSSPQVVPESGGDGAESPASKNKKPRKPKKPKTPADGTPAPAEETPNDKGKQPADITQGVKNLNVFSPSPRNPASPLIQPSSNASPEDKQKRAKAVSKKLIQIERLKKKQADGHPLSQEEQLKVNSESSLKQEMNSYSKQ